MNTSEKVSDLDRRGFLQRGSLATLMMMMGAVELRPAENPDSPAGGDKKSGPPVKIGVIGCGNWGREILRALARLPNAPVTAICDVYEPFLNRAANFAPGAEKTGDYRSLLEKKDLPAIVVATPSHLHRDITLAAMQAGKHVYCEAPLAINLEDASLIAKTARTASKQIFQCGLLCRSNPIHKHVAQFVQQGALGKTVLVRAQFHKRQSLRRPAPTPEREKAANWHLHQETSIGLIGEIGIHALDNAQHCLKQQPQFATGFGSINAWEDGRDVPDTVQTVLEFPNATRMFYDATLGNSFDGSFEVFCGTDGAITIRENRAWMIKETDAPLLGWEAYARKEEFVPSQETGLALIANSTRLLAQGKEPAAAAATADSPLFYALEEWIANINENKAPAAGAQEGYEAAVLAIKTNEAVVKNQKITFAKEWFEAS
jgi:predicted dehydrogenase